MTQGRINIFPASGCINNNHESDGKTSEDVEGDKSVKGLFHYYTVDEEIKIIIRRNFCLHTIKSKRIRLSLSSWERQPLFLS